MNIIEKTYQWAYEPDPRKEDDIKYIILHHAAASSCTADDIHRWHLNNGWAGIGYNYFVRKDGSIYRGRGELQCGAHTEGHNKDGLGICAEGNFQTEDMPQLQKQAIIDLIRDIRSRLGELPVKGHRDFNATACPGERFPMSEISSAAEEKEQTEIKVSETNPVKTEAKQVEAETEQEECEVKLSILGKGDKGSSVKALQILLIGNGYNCGGYGSDGVFGSGTEASVKAYQKAKGLSVDGIVGEKTWTSLLK